MWASLQSAWINAFAISLLHSGMLICDWALGIVTPAWHSDSSLYYCAVSCSLLRICNHSWDKISLCLAAARSDTCVHTRMSWKPRHCLHCAKKIWDSVGSRVLFSHTWSWHAYNPGKSQLTFHIAILVGWEAEPYNRISSYWGLLSQVASSAAAKSFLPGGQSGSTGRNVPFLFQSVFNYKGRPRLTLLRWICLRSTFQLEQNLS